MTNDKNGQKLLNSSKFHFACCYVFNADELDEVCP